nr:hypothetical protein [Tanacetum cinerariifolium]
SSVLVDAIDMEIERDEMDYCFWILDFGNIDLLIERSDVDFVAAVESVYGSRCRMIPRLVIILEGEMCTSVKISSHYFLSLELTMSNPMFFDQPRPPDKKKSHQFVALLFTVQTVFNNNFLVTVDVLF